MSNATTFRSKFESAVNAWNSDPGPIERTIEAGENLYFAAHNLIDELTEQRKVLLEALTASEGLVELRRELDDCLDDERDDLERDYAEIKAQIDAAIARAKAEA